MFHTKLPQIKQIDEFASRLSGNIMEMQRDARWASGLLITTSGLPRSLKQQIQLEIEEAGGRWGPLNRPPSPLPVTIC